MLTLKASPSKLVEIKEARERKGWAIEDTRWLVAASDLLEPNINWQELGTYANGVSLATFKRFLQGKKAIKVEAFQAFCQILALNWQDMAGIDTPHRATSDLFVARLAYESQCHQEVVKPGALLRIKAPEQMGKTWLLDTTLQIARQQGYQAQKLDFQQVDSQILRDYQEFLQWFCVNVSEAFELEDCLDEYWKTRSGINRNCTRYFQKYILVQIDSPLVLGLDNVDLVFEQPGIFNDFCRLLRAWHDLAKQIDSIGETWQKMRLIIVHSTEVYSGMDLNYSPLANVGQTIELSEFNQEQVLALAKQYQLNLDLSTAEKLMAMIGGHPALVRQALDNLKQQNITLEELLNTAPTNEGVFQNHLGRCLQTLHKYPDLAEALLITVNSDVPVEIASEKAFKLHRMGLVKPQANCVVPRCNLYRQYFRSHL